MARQPRFLLAGQPHLVLQQGHNRNPIARDEDDRLHWLVLLRDTAATHRVVLHAWGLGSDRFALLLTPPSALALSRMMQTLGRRYVGWFNARHGRSGTLWDGRFRACVVEGGAWLLAAMHHVEGLPGGHDGGSPGVSQAPLTASSLAHHLGRVVDPALSDIAAYWALGNTPFDRQAVYGRQADAGLSARQRDAIEAALRGGRPLGSAAWVATLQQGSARPLLKATPKSVPAARITLLGLRFRNARSEASLAGAKSWRPEAGSEIARSNLSRLRSSLRIAALAKRLASFGTWSPTTLSPAARIGR